MVRGRAGRPRSQQVAGAVLSTCSFHESHKWKIFFKTQPTNQLAVPQPYGTGTLRREDPQSQDPKI